jgi:hypothetical protein
MPDMPGDEVSEEMAGVGRVIPQDTVCRYFSTPETAVVTNIVPSP